MGQRIKIKKVSASRKDGKATKKITVHLVTNTQISVPIKQYIAAESSGVDTTQYVKSKSKVVLVKVKKV